MLPGETIEGINSILRGAASDGRRILYEYEVYEILGLLGLEIPRYVFVEYPSRVDEAALRQFGGSLVVKVVSPDIAHKHKAGGVRILHDLGNVRRELEDMDERVLSRFEDGQKPRIKGFLLAQFIPFTPALGNETLLGFRQDFAFGPVVTVSKGGDDAEFFAKYYDPANLVIPPLDPDEAMREIGGTLSIRHKFEDWGKGQYLERIAEAASVLSRLAYAYSSAARRKPEFIITALDINPFVFAGDGRFIAVDGFAEFAPAAEGFEPLPAIRTDNLDRFFHPRGIAVAGVSTDMDKYSLGREIAHLLHNYGRSDVYLINPRGGSLCLDGVEYPLYQSLDDIEAQTDLVVYAAPAQHTLDFIGHIPEGRGKSVILISGIPSDTPYADFKKGLDAVLPEGTRIIGPNCMGVYYGPGEAGGGVNTLFIEERKLEVKSSTRSNTALLSQSGALAVTLIDKLKHSRLLKAVVSFGNQYDVKITDLIEYFTGDDAVEIIALYLEGFDRGEGRVFFEQARACPKPILVYKSGKTEAGARAAASHTAAMSGSYDVFRAACRQAGVVLAEEIDDYENDIRAFSLLARKKPRGNRVAGVFNAGFESTIGADELSGLRQAQLGRATAEKLRQADEHGLVDISSSFVDVTPMADDAMFAAFVEILLEDEDVDCVFAAIVPHTSALNTLPETCGEPGGLASRLVALFEKYEKPVVVSVNAGTLYREFAAVMEEKGLPVFADARSAIKSLDRYVSYRTL